MQRSNDTEKFYKYKVYSRTYAQDPSKNNNTYIVKISKE